MSLLVHCPQTGFTPIQTDHDMAWWPRSQGGRSSGRFCQEILWYQVRGARRREKSVWHLEILSDQEMVIQETKTECCYWHHDAITTDPSLACQLWSLWMRIDSPPKTFPFAFLGYIQFFNGIKLHRGRASRKHFINLYWKGLFLSVNLARCQLDHSLVWAIKLQRSPQWCPHSQLSSPARSEQ